MCRDRVFQRAGRQVVRLEFSNPEKVREAPRAACAPLGKAEEAHEEGDADGEDYNASMEGASMKE